MNTLTPLVRQQFLTGARSWLTGTYRVALMGTGYEYEDEGPPHRAPVDVYLSDLTDVVATQILAGLTAVDGVAGADPLVLSGVAAGTDFLGMWVYADTGTPSTSTLVAWLDTQDDVTPLGGTATGLDIHVAWPATGVFTL